MIDMLRTEKSLLQNRVADRKCDKKNRFLTIALEYLADTKQQSRRKRMRYFRRQTTKLKFHMTVWDIGSSLSKGEKKERERVTTKIFPRAFQPDEDEAFAGSRST